MKHKKIILSLVLAGAALIAIIKRLNRNKNDSSAEPRQFDEGEFHASVSFGKKSKHFDAEGLQSASLSCSFGELNAYFDNSTLHTDGAELLANCSFGEINIFIPKTWKVENKISASFGDLREKNRGQNDSGGVLTVRGSVSFGDVCINYV
ncbi:MAG: hypothetical protein FWF08_09705 [Oscillospiraceae bacterium]|nr:hypothetical protein [Oscillospiraceae bacterium]